ncbi:hypothetical protein SAY86_000193 [Trapa natans]|uniref:Uncharacterized protein n=1 Tax=Trapa natans TaxID=22666 RepID=A0AAN7M9T0_TRANT|nr:hypothetical protein SAY86_000193 [Trapa natans]
MEMPLAACYALTFSMIHANFNLESRKQISKYGFQKCTLNHDEQVWLVAASSSEYPHPDLASYLYKNPIVYLGMSRVPPIT